jgi:hypothetical protein
VYLGDDPAGAVERLGLAEEPGVAVLLLAAQQVQLVVPQHALGAPGLDKPTHQGDDRGAVRAPVGQVAEEDQPPPLGMPPPLVVAEPGEQRPDGFDLPMNVGHDVEWTIEEGLHEAKLGH